MSKLFFSKDEKLQLENNVLKENNMALQIKLLQGERESLITDFVKRNSRKTEDVVNVNVQEGSVEFKEAEDSKSKKKINK